jgi:hypothetical protein
LLHGKYPRGIFGRRVPSSAHCDAFLNGSFHLSNGDSAMTPSRSWAECIQPRQATKGHHPPHCERLIDSTIHVIPSIQIGNN